VPADSNDAPPVDHHNAVGIDGSGQPVRDHERGAIAHEPLQRVLDQPLALRIEGARGLIQQLDKGYNTMIGERGVRLSGGQKQRIAIARALLMNPGILILDEFTSSVDVATERLIRQALIELMRNRTTFVIAHRLSTVRAADQILVLEAGKLVAIGTHDALIESSPLYRDTYALQLQTDEDATRNGQAAEMESPSPSHGPGGQLVGEGTFPERPPLLERAPS